MADAERRKFLRGAAMAAGMALLRGGGLSAQQKESAGKKEEEVSPAEDLMREHGVLNRVLLIYDEGLRRLRASSEELDPAVLASSAGIIRNFIEDYHEKLEEDFLFPRFEKAGKLTDLVQVLRAQHRAGRRLTEQIRALASAKTLRSKAARNQLGDALQSFVLMYRPHEAREDTVLFPAFRSLVTPNEYAALGEQFEDKEHELFGEDGFERMVESVAKLEKTLGIYELARFTPTT